MSGFITIERAIWDHPIFKPESMTEREAWMWMLANAAYKGTRHRVGSELFDVPRGSFMATLREMQSAFMWKSDKRVRTFLKTLEKEAMIGRTVVGTANAPKTHVTICKYEEYQSRGRTKDAPQTHDGTHDGRTTDAVKKQGNKVTIEEEAKASLSPSVKKPKKRAYQISEDAVISDRQIQIAKDKGHGIDEAKAQFDRFKNKNLADGRAYTLWDSAWSNWLTSPYFKLITSGSNGKPASNQKTFAEQDDDRARRASDRWLMM